MLDDEIFVLLREKVEVAKRAHAEAEKSYWEAVGKFRGYPTIQDGIPDSAGSELIRRAGLRTNVAMETYYEALNNLNGYLLHGTVPNDVREKSRKSRSINMDSVALVRSVRHTVAFSSESSAG